MTLLPVIIVVVKLLFTALEVTGCKTQQMGDHLVHPCSHPCQDTSRQVLICFTFGPLELWFHLHHFLMQTPNLPNPTPSYQTMC